MRFSISFSKIRFKVLKLIFMGHKKYVLSLEKTDVRIMFVIIPKIMILINET
tara:strand:- start:76 stop:231 length:156 start_codon:yes stop_codon:yes gene_type:complete